MANIPDDSKSYFSQSELPPPPPPELNIETVPTGSQVTEGDLRSPNFVHNQSGWRISSDGTAEFQQVIVNNASSFSESGTWYKPVGGSMAFIECWGGGGGGGSAYSNPSCAGGGGGGGYRAALIPLSYLPNTVTVTVGTGGLGGAFISSSGNKNDGSAGGDTSFGTYVSANGGAGGGSGFDNVNASGGTGGAFGAGSVVEVNAEAGSNGGTGSTVGVGSVTSPSNTISSGAGGGASYGDVGTSATNGGTSTAGNNGGDGAVAIGSDLVILGGDGEGYGGGGGGASAIYSGCSTKGGNGANGFCKITII